MLILLYVPIQIGLYIRTNTITPVFTRPCQSLRRFILCQEIVATGSSHHNAQLRCQTSPVIRHNTRNTVIVYIYNCMALLCNVIKPAFYPATTLGNFRLPRPCFCNWNPAIALIARFSPPNASANLLTPVNKPLIRSKSALNPSVSTVELANC